MHFAVVGKHRDFFRKHHWLECEEVLPENERQRLSEAIAAALGKNETAADIFAAGRDLWRDHPAIKKAISKCNLAEIAGELIEQKPLRLGYDMLLPAPSAFDHDSSYSKFLKTTPTLTEMSCIQGIACGAMLCVSGPSNLDISTSSSIGLFSNRPGNVIIFSSDWHLPLHEIYERAGFSYLLIAFAVSNSVYYLQPNDPHVHHLKRLGYQFGDRLKDVWNPIVYQ